MAFFLVVIFLTICRMDILKNTLLPNQMRRPIAVWSIKEFLYSIFIYFRLFFILFNILYPISYILYPYLKLILYRSHAFAFTFTLRCVEILSFPKNAMAFSLQSFFYKNNLRQIYFQLLSDNLVFAFVGVLQAQIFGCACLKCKWSMEHGNYCAMLW